MMEEAQRNNDVMPFDPKAMQLSNKDMERLAEQAQQAAKEGRMADAQQQMAQLEKMLDQLRNARTQGGDKKQANSKRQKGKRQQSAVQDMIGREGKLLDHAQQRGNQNPTAPQPGDPSAEREADSRVQKALRRALGELMQQFSDQTGEASQGLGEADQAMREAQSQLNQGNDEGARQSQQEAIAALQKGSREMAQTMAKQNNGSQPGEGEEGEEGEDGSQGAMGMMMPDDQRGDGRGTGPMPGSPDRADPGGRDPLGRYNQGMSSDNADVTVPEERERQRTQAIQEELRRRGAEQERPRQELDYIDRLLKQF
jgi:Asp-tRNA(Asn)/Glu-tRNA(Gln) amidotransferase C subunit